MKRKQPTRLSKASETGRMRMIDGRCLIEARGGGGSARQPMKRTSLERPSESVIDAHHLTDVRDGGPVRASAGGRLEAVLRAAAGTRARRRAGATANGTQADQAG